MINSEGMVKALQTYAHGLETGSKGWSICCPFHNDSNPSCTVFYQSGVFSCLACGKRASPQEGLAKIGVSKSDIESIVTNDPLKTNISLKALLEDESQDFTPVSRYVSEQQIKISSEPNFGVFESSLWPDDWNYRGIRSELLTHPSSYLVKVFRPRLVRLWMKTRKGKLRERYPRLGLDLSDEHSLYLRLAQRQKIKVRNSHGLSLRNPLLAPFGMLGFDLSPEIKGIIVVEGPYDLMRTYQNLYDLGMEQDYQLVALLGTGQWVAFREKFESRLLSQMEGKELILAFDNDKAGQDLTDNVFAEAKERLWFPQNRIKILSYTSHDPGDMDKKEFKEAINGISN